MLATQSALDNDGALLSDAERATVDRLMEQVRAMASSTDHQQIKASVLALADGTEEFAARRMDRSVRSALAGRRLDEV